MNDRISVNPQVHFGRPCISGTRIPVQDVLELVRDGIPFGEIVKDYYPDLEPDDVRACVQYAIDAIDAPTDPDDLCRLTAEVLDDENWTMPEKLAGA